MNMVKNYEGLKLDLQLVNVDMNKYLERKIHNMIMKLRNLRADINWMDIYLKSTEEVNRSRSITVRFGIPGLDFNAADTGDRWKMVIKNVEKRLIRQMEKRKTVLLKMAG